MRILVHILILSGHVHSPVAPITAKEPEKVSKALAYPCLKWLVEYLLVKATAIGLEARWNEGCRCHGEFLKQHPEKRRRLHDRGDGQETCPWRGRRAVEQALGRPSIALQNIQGATSPALAKILAELSPQERATCLQKDARLMAVCGEEW